MFRFPNGFSHICSSPYRWVYQTNYSQLLSFYWFSGSVPSSFCERPSLNLMAWPPYVSQEERCTHFFFSHMPLSWNYFYLHVLRSSVGNACLKKLSYPRLVTHECLLYYRLYNYVKVSMWAWFLPDEKCGVSAWLSRGLVGRSSAKRRNAFFEQCRSSWTVKSTT